MVTHSGIASRNVIRKSLTGLVTGAAVLSLAACGSDADADAGFPTNTIELVVPYAPGGSTDTSMRRLTQIAEDTCGTDMIVSNQTGGAGTVGATAVANSKPDGYTVGATAADLIIPHQLGVAEVSVEDVKGVLRYALNERTLFVPASSEFESLADIIDAAQYGETINVATAGSGTEMHLSTVGMAMDQGVVEQFNFLPFDGDATALEAVAGGQADMTVISTGTGVPQVEGGNARALVTLGEERSEILPDVPTATEQGIDWIEPAPQGLVVPAETPDDVVKKLNECLGEAVESDEFKETMANQNLTIGYQNAEEYEAYLAEMSEYYGRIITEAGMAQN